jgi:hypothetical protein
LASFRVEEGTSVMGSLRHSRVRVVVVPYRVAAVRVEEYEPVEENGVYLDSYFHHHDTLNSLLNLCSLQQEGRRTKSSYQ